MSGAAWRDLVLQPGGTVEGRRGIERSLRDLGPARAYGPLHEQAAAIAVLHGPAAARDLLYPVAAAWPEVVRVLGRPSPWRADFARGALALQHVLSCYGLGPRPLLPVAAWIKVAAEAEIKGGHALLAFLSLGTDAALVAPFLGGAPVSAATSGARFGMDPPALAHYLQAAIHQRARASVTRAAWTDFLCGFADPAARTGMGYTALMAVARVQRHIIGGAPVGTVADWLHGEATRIS